MLCIVLEITSNVLAFIGFAQLILETELEEQAEYGTIGEIPGGTV